MISNANRSIMIIGLQARKGALQLLIKFVMRKLARLSLDNHVYINGWAKVGTKMSKIFPYPPFNAIAAHGIADFTTDSDTQTRPGGRAGSGNHKKMSRMVLASGPPYNGKLTGSVQTTFWWKGKYPPCRPFICQIRFQMNKLLGGNGNDQLLAPLGTASFQNVAAAIGAHPLTKTMSTLAADPAWLISAFHNSVQLLL